MAASSSLKAYSLRFFLFLSFLLLHICGRSKRLTALQYSNHGEEGGTFLFGYIYISFSFRSIFLILLEGGVTARRGMRVRESVCGIEGWHVVCGVCGVMVVRDGADDIVVWRVGLQEHMSMLP